MMKAWNIAVVAAVVCSLGQFAQAGNSKKIRGKAYSLPKITAPKVTLPYQTRGTRTDIGQVNLTNNKSQKSASKKKIDAALCGSVGYGGASVKGCIGTSGVSGSVSIGSGVSVGTTYNKGWNRRQSSTCVTTTGSAGKGVFVTGSGGVCNQNGKPYTKTTGGGGVGVGTEGWKAAASIEVSSTKAVKKVPSRNRRNRK